LDLFELTKKLVAIPSPSGEEKEVIDFLSAYLKSLDFFVELQEVNKGRSNIYARSGEPAIVFSTHVDTVLPFLPLSEDSKFIYGRGACDAKGIIAAQIKAAEKLISAGIKGIGLLFVVGEESGSDGAKKANLIPNSSRFLINGEPTENKLAVGTKGALRVKISTTGKAAHSAYPERGESAIVKLLDVLNDLRNIPLPVDDLLGETSLNIGTISGGTQANVIPDHAAAELMIRTVREISIMKDLIEKKVGDRAEINYLFESQPIFLETLEEFETSVVSFATDIPLLTNWGKPFLLGPGSILDAHTPGEKISKEELLSAVDIYCKLVEKLI